MNIPGFTAERSLVESRGNHVQSTKTQLSQNRKMNEIVPAVPMPYCKAGRAGEVCVTLLPGYPPPKLLYLQTAMLDT